MNKKSCTGRRIPIELDDFAREMSKKNGITLQEAFRRIARRIKKDNGKRIIKR